MAKVLKHRVLYKGAVLVAKWDKWQAHSFKKIAVSKQVFSKSQNWAAIVAKIKTRFHLYKKNNEIVAKLNNNILVEKIKKQAPKGVTHRIDSYFIENKIITTKFYAAQTLSNEDISI